MKLTCKKCSEHCRKAGKQKNGIQKWECKTCHLFQQAEYRYAAYHIQTNQHICDLLKEGCGIRSIARLLHISNNTVLKRILSIAKQIEKPPIAFEKEFEMDEMRSYIGKKSRQVWIAYAIRKDTREIVDFRVGRRTHKTLLGVIDTLLCGSAKKIYTDKLPAYAYLISKNIHSTKHRSTNYIERKNLSLRTHLKQLSRKTICYSKSLSMLSACLKIYFWQDYNCSIS